MFRPATSLFALLLVNSFLIAGDEDGFKSIFDGKSFEGWEGNMQMFRIEDEAIVAGTLDAKIPRNEFLCTRKEYDDFELRLQFKLLGEPLVSNAGIQIRSRRVPNNSEVSGYQADLAEEWWGSLFDESRRNQVLVRADQAAVKQVLHHEDWNDYRIRCEGRRIQLWINGLPTVDFLESDDDIEPTGIIGLQIHEGGPAEARYKNIRIKELLPD